MAAFGILAALRERDRSGEGQLVDVSMADGALSWLAMVAARVPRRRASSRARGELELAGAARLLPALRVRRRLGHARRAGAEVLAAPGAAASGARTSSSSSSTRPGSDAHARGRGGLPRAHARRVAARSPSEHDCCLEPVLDLDEALDSELVRAREMVVELDQPGARRAGAAARRPGQAEPHAGRREPRARARRWASTPTRCCADAGLRRRARSRRC